MREACPELAPFVHPHPLAGDTIDFADPAAVTALNRALLKFHYGIAPWHLPPGYLCPPIPSRVNYLHHVADLLAEGSGSPRGETVRVLDIGVGANGIYPLLGARVYGWSFVGSDIDSVAVAHVRQLAAANPAIGDRIEVRHQPSSHAIFANVTQPGETFALSLCNPPFHASAADAEAGTRRKLRNLGGGRKPAKTVLNFGGRSNELWCDGGEVGFVRRMIAESAARPDLCMWFTTLVSQSEHLPELERALKQAAVTETRTVPMAAGQKQTRILAWTFKTKTDRQRGSR